MTVPHIFGTQPAGNVPASYLDENFAYLGNTTITWSGDSSRAWTWQDMDTAYAAGAGELLLSNLSSANNVLALQGGANGYSAVALKDINGIEQGAVGYSMAGGSGNIFAGYNYIESSGFDHISGPANGFLIFQTGTYSSTLSNWVVMEITPDTNSDLNFWSKATTAGSVNNKRFSLLGDTGQIMVGDKVSIGRSLATAAFNVIDSHTELLRLTQDGVRTAKFNMSATGLTVRDADNSLNVATFEMNGGGQFQVTNDLLVGRDTFLTDTLTIGSGISNGFYWNAWLYQTSNVGATALSSSFAVGLALGYNASNSGGEINYANAGIGGHKFQHWTGAALTDASITASAITASGLISALSSTAVASGSAAQAFIKASSTSNLGLYYGTGDPSFSAAKGSIYSRTDASIATARLWTNSDGSTTWVFATMSA